METRIYNDDIEVRELEDGTRTLSGYGIVFNSDSEVMGDFTERILPTALDGIEFNDVVATFNHNVDNILGRMPETLQLEKNQRGVKYSIKLPNTTVANDLFENIRMGNVKGSSFTFKIASGGDSWEKRGEMYERTISKIERVWEMGPVVMPAYPKTTVKIRDIQSMFEESERKQFEEKLKLQERAIILENS